jgi:DNA-binding GntR family transcriptional regulator
VPREELPPYLRVSDALREKIRSGELLPGEQLPSLDRISADYGISRATAQKAVRVLISEGLATSRPRWGVFVKQS